MTLSPLEYDCPVCGTHGAASCPPMDVVRCPHCGNLPGDIAETEEGKDEHVMLTLDCPKCGASIEMTQSWRRAVGL